MSASVSDTVMQAASYVAAHLDPLSITPGVLEDGNSGFRAQADDDLLTRDYVIANGWWYWRTSPIPELPAHRPEFYAIQSVRADEAGITAFLAWHLADSALPVLIGDRFAGEPYTDENRLIRLADQAAAEEHDPVAAKRWWDISVTYLVLLARGDLGATAESVDDAQRYLQMLGISVDEVPEPVAERLGRAPEPAAEPIDDAEDPRDLIKALDDEWDRQYLAERDQWYQHDFPATREGQLTAAFGVTAESEDAALEDSIPGAPETYVQVLFDADRARGICLYMDPLGARYLYLRADDRGQPIGWKLELVEIVENESNGYEQALTDSWFIGPLELSLSETANRITETLERLKDTVPEESHRVVLGAYVKWSAIVLDANRAIDGFREMLNAWGEEDHIWADQDAVIRRLKAKARLTPEQWTYIASDDL